MGYEKKTYLPGIVDCYQKPWYTRTHSGNVRYRGQFCEKGYDRIFMSFDPIRKLVDEVKDPELQDRMLTLIEEMEDAYRANEANHMHNMPSHMWE